MEETRELMEETENLNESDTGESAADEAQEEAAESETATDRVWTRLSEELTELHRGGWSIEQLTELAADEGVRSALASGETLKKAAEAYSARKADGEEVTEENKPAAERRGRKRGVPALKTATTGSVPEWNAIARMNGSEFAKFSDDVYQRLMAGEKIAL